MIIKTSLSTDGTNHVKVYLTYHDMIVPLTDEFRKLVQDAVEKAFDESIKDYQNGN